MFEFPDIRRRRIALYSHDSQGLGHIRRNLAIAGTLAATDPAPEILLITGAPGAAALPVPPGADFLILPALGKRVDGSYRARTLAAPLGALIELRSRILQAALSSFDPDLLIVDKVPRGAGNELERALVDLRSRGRARCVLGLRDVLDTTEMACQEWRQQGATEAVAHYYDAVWVYGDPLVFDPVREYGLPPIVARRTTFTGYLGHGRPTAPPVSATAPPGGPYDLCLVGGGQDGLHLARAFVSASLADGRSGVVLTGPYMDDDDRRALDHLTARRPHMAVAGYVDGTDHFIAGAGSVVSMGGYNSVCELLAAGTRSLIVPRTRPRAEQLVRARRLAQMGLIDVLHPDDLSSERLTAWLAAAPGVPAGADGIDLDGLARIPALVDALLFGVGAPLNSPSDQRQVVDVAV